MMIELVYVYIDIISNVVLIKGLIVIDFVNSIVYFF